MSPDLPQNQNGAKCHDIASDTHETQHLVVSWSLSDSETGEEVQPPRADVTKLSRLNVKQKCLHLVWK